MIKKKFINELKDDILKQEFYLDVMIGQMDE